MRISVLGTGYLGAVHAACLAAWGHDVVGVDTDPHHVEQLAQGVAPFHEPGFPQLLRAGVEAGRLRFVGDYRAAADFADVHFVCVGTPQRADGRAADLTAVWDTADRLAPLLRRPCLVVGKSTVPPGTAAALARRFDRGSPVPVRVAWNPEFLREGHAVADSMHPDRLVFGVADDESAQVLREVYARPLADGVPAVRTDLETAELAKVAANVMLAARLSVLNALAEVCEHSGADVGDLTRILGSDPRIGAAFLSPGLGFGGGCLPKDLRACAALADELGLTDAAALFDGVDTVNTGLRTRVAELAAELADGSLHGARVTVLGAAFKAGSDDVRDSPALAVAHLLQDRGAGVTVHDPRAGANVRRVYPDLRVEDSLEAACRGADLLLVLNEWEEYRELDPVSVASWVAVPRVVDARLTLDADKWQAAGWQVRSPGRRTP